MKKIFSVILSLTLLCSGFRVYQPVTALAEDNILFDENFENYTENTVLLSHNGTGDEVGDFDSEDGKWSVKRVGDSKGELSVIKADNSLDPDGTRGNILKYVNKHSYWYITAKIANAQNRGKMLIYEYDFYRPDTAELELPSYFDGTTQTHEPSRMAITTPSWGYQLNMGTGVSVSGANKLDKKYEAFMQTLNMNNSGNGGDGGTYGVAEPGKWHSVKVIVDTSETATASRPDTYRMYIDGEPIYGYYCYGANGLADQSKKVYDFSTRFYTSNASGISNYSVNDIKGLHFGYVWHNSSQVPNDWILYLDNMKVYTADKFEITEIGTNKDLVDVENEESLDINFSAPLSEKSRNEIYVADVDGKKIDGAVKSAVLSADNVMSVNFDKSKLASLTSYKLMLTEQFTALDGQALCTYSAQYKHNADMPCADASVNKTGETEIEFKTGIIKQNITGVTFADASYTYDGTEKILEVSGNLPEGVTVSYINNKGTEIGEYEATAILQGEGYHTLTLYATLRISEKVLKDITGVYFDNKTVKFDGTEKVIEVTGAIPDGATVKYTNNKGTEIGEYNATAYISGDDYKPLTLYAKLSIISPFDVERENLFNDNFENYLTDSDLFTEEEFASGAVKTTKDGKYSVYGVESTTGEIKIVSADSVVPGDFKRGNVLKFSNDTVGWAPLFLRANVSSEKGNTRGKILVYEYDVYLDNGQVDSLDRLMLLPSYADNTSMVNTNYKPAKLPIYRASGTAGQIEMGTGIGRCEERATNNKKLDRKYECVASTYNSTISESKSDHTTDAWLKTNNWHRVKCVVDTSKEATATRPDTYRCYIDGNLVYGYYVSGEDTLADRDTKVYDFAPYDYISNEKGISGYQLDNFAGLLMGRVGCNGYNPVMYVDNLNVYTVADKFEVVSKSGINEEINMFTDKITLDFSTPVSEESLEKIAVCDIYEEKIENAILALAVMNDGCSINITLNNKILEEGKSYILKLPEDFCDKFGQGIVTYYAKTRHSDGMPVEDSSVPENGVTLYNFTTKIVDKISATVTPEAITGFDKGDNGKITVKFSEEVVPENGAKLADVFSVTDEEGKIIRGLSVTLSEDKKSVEMDLSGLELGEGTHLITTNKDLLKGVSGKNAYVVIKVDTLDFNASYDEQISAYSEGEERSSVISFTLPFANVSEEIINSFTTLDAENNQINGLEISVSADKKSIILSPENLELGIGTHTIKSTGVIKDKRGRTLNIAIKIEPIAFNAYYENNISDYEAGTKKDIAIKLTQALDSSTVSELNNLFTVTNSYGNEVNGLKVDVSDNFKNITLSFDELYIDGGNYKISSAGNSIKSKHGYILGNPVEINLSTISDKAEIKEDKGVHKSSGTSLDGEFNLSEFINHIDIPKTGVECDKLITLTLSKNLSATSLKYFEKELKLTDDCGNEIETEIETVSAKKFILKPLYNLKKNQTYVVSAPQSVFNANNVLVNLISETADVYPGLYYSFVTKGRDVEVDTEKSQLTFEGISFYNASSFEYSLKLKNSYEKDILVAMAVYGKGMSLSGIMYDEIPAGISEKKLNVSEVSDNEYVRIYLWEKDVNTVFGTMLQKPVEISCK